jgi:sugar phosphate permease
MAGATCAFLLMYSPRWLFLYPGIASILLGLAVCFWLLPGPRRMGDIVFDVHTLAYAFGSMLVLCQNRSE